MTKRVVVTDYTTILLGNLNRANNIINSQDFTKISLKMNQKVTYTCVCVFTDNTYTYTHTYRNTHIHSWISLSI